MDDDEALEALTDDSEDEPIDGDARLKVYQLKDETLGQANARVTLTPEYNACYAIWQLNQITPFKAAGITALAKRLESQCELMKEGDLGQAESMLYAQAQTLDALFHNLLTRSALNIKNDFSVVDRLLKLALKAQSQCRTTLESLASIRKPPEPIRQTNIAHGHQQVNNFPEKQLPPNELLEEKDGLDRGATQEAIRGDQTLETVAAKHRAKDK